MKAFYPKLTLNGPLDSYFNFIWPDYNIKWSIFPPSNTPNDIGEHTHKLFLDTN